MGPFPRETLEARIRGLMAASDADLPDRVARDGFDACATLAEREA